MHVEGELEKFLIFRTFIIHFTLSLIFIRVSPIEDLLFEIRLIDKLGKFKYIHNTQSAQILQKHDGYNTYVIIKINVPSCLCGLNKHTGHRYL